MANLGTTFDTNTLPQSTGGNFDPLPLAGTQPPLRKPNSKTPKAEAVNILRFAMM